MSGFSSFGANSGFNSLGKTSTFGMIKGELLSSPLNLNAVAGDDFIELSWDDQNETYRKSISISGIGSTAMHGGSGVSSINNSYMGLLRSAIESLSENVVFNNLAVANQDIFHLAPNGFSVPVGHAGVNVSGNITYALSLDPDFVILGESANSIINGYSVSQIMSAYAAIKNAASSAGKQIVILCPHPQVTISYFQRAEIKNLSNSLVSEFGSDIINVFDQLVES